MTRWKPLGPYLLLNVIVSALTTLLVLAIWARSQPAGVEQPSAQIGEVGGNPAVQNGESSGGDGGSVISQLAISSVVGAGDLSSERVLIQYVGDGEVSLAGWQLKDEEGNTFTFPGLTMFSGGAVTVHTAAGTNTVVDLYWGLEQAIWREGEQVSLLDPDGNVAATYFVP